jgi:hypothetical protein
VPAVTPLRSPSTAGSCARIDSRPDKAKIGSADRVEVHHARLLATIGVRKTFPHGLGHKRHFNRAPVTSGLPPMNRPRRHRSACLKCAKTGSRPSNSQRQPYQGNMGAVKRDLATSVE